MRDAPFSAAAAGTPRLTDAYLVALERTVIVPPLPAAPESQSRTAGRTVRVALWNGEEQGLWGSRAYVRRHFGSPRDSLNPPKPAHEKFAAYVNQDYGAGQHRGIYLQGNEAARTMLTAWTEPFRDFGMTTVSNQSVGSTDHVPFDDAGLPGFRSSRTASPAARGARTSTTSRRSTRTT